MMKMKMMNSNKSSNNNNTTATAAAATNDNDNGGGGGGGTGGDEYEEEETEDEKLWHSAEHLRDLERRFWKRLGPTMPPASYGADQEGTLFADGACGWSLANLDSCLSVLCDDYGDEDDEEGSDNNKASRRRTAVPGVTSPYLYTGMWGSVFCAHTEDLDLLSINYLHAGAPKIWYAVAEPDAARFASLCEGYFPHRAQDCKEFMRHKQCLLSPHVLQKAGIRYTTAVQFPGEAIITFPASYHFGFNAGFNVAEATNFGVPEWLPRGRTAKVCLCRPDSVRIDLSHLCAVLRQYQADQKQRRRKQQGHGQKKQSFTEWNRQQHLRLRREEQKVLTPTPVYNRGENNNAENSSDTEDSPHLMAAKALSALFTSSPDQCVSSPVTPSPSHSPSLSQQPTTTMLSATEQQTQPPGRMLGGCMVGGRMMGGRMMGGRMGHAAGATAQPVATAPPQTLSHGKPNNGSSKSRQQRERQDEFWVEVVEPVTAKDLNPNSKKMKKQKGKRKNKPKSRGKNDGDDGGGGVWHLAKATTRKALHQKNARVLFIRQAVRSGGGATNNSKNKQKPKNYSDDTDDDENNDDEQCFAGHIVEIQQEHARIRFDGMFKTDDEWVALDNADLFLDGGVWDDASAAREEAIRAAMEQKRNRADAQQQKKKDQEKRRQEREKAKQKKEEERIRKKEAAERRKAEKIEKLKEKNKKRKQKEQQQMIDEGNGSFWVEVVEPVLSSSGRKMCMVKKGQDDEDLWHLALPSINRDNGASLLKRNADILCLLSVARSRTVNGVVFAAATGGSDDTVDTAAAPTNISAAERAAAAAVTGNVEVNGEYEEQCFAGRIVQVTKEAIRIRLCCRKASGNGSCGTNVYATETSYKESSNTGAIDIFMPVASPKVFLDGGRWSKETPQETLEPLQYWQVVDSKKRQRQ